MLNIEKYKDEILNEWRESEECDLLEDIKCVAHRHGSKDFTCESLMDWLCEEYKEPLLNDKEKEFLQDLMKWYVFDEIAIGYENIMLLAGYQKEKDVALIIIADIESQELECTHVSIPTLDGGAVFSKLTLGVVYTLEELGI